MNGTFPRNGDRPGELAMRRPDARGKTLRGAQAVHGKKRCRMHGGAQGSGAPTGNRNAVKHGLYTRAAIEQRKQLRTLMRDARKLVHGIA